jgi:hypothetical protein
MDPFGLSPEQYTAAAEWVSALVLIASIFFAVVQVREARLLREEQARPWVVAKFHPDVAFAIVIVNIGQTVARDVTITFEPPLESTWDRPWGWEESSMLTEGIPMLPPGEELRFHFDTFHERVKSQLPMVYSVTVSYSTAAGRQLPPDRYVLDLRLYTGMAVPPPTLPDLVRELERVRKELAKWTDSTRGLLVHVVDREKSVRRRDRPWLITRALRVLKKEGPLAFVDHIFTRWRQRLGLYTKSRK